MLGPELKLRRELEAGTYLPHTPADLEHLGVTLPEKLNGLKILDIGAGISTIGLDLEKRGATVVSCDIGYKNTEEMKQDAIHYSRSFLKDLPPALRSMSTKRIEKETREQMEKTIYTFFRRFKKERGRFVAGMAGFLPFKDESFDFVFSQNLISPGLLTDFEIGFASITEAIRVTKTGGEIQITPIEAWAQNAPPGRKIAARMLIDTLEVSGLNYQFISAGADAFLGNRTLKIVK